MKRKFRRDRTMRLGEWFCIRKELPRERRAVLAVLSFVLPLSLWALVSYVPFIWHPFVLIDQPGSIEYFQSGMRIDRAAFAVENSRAASEGRALAEGRLVNPVYLPAPHQVARALYSAFNTPPRLPSEPWLHQSLWHSLKIILAGFALSSFLGVPLGILCGTFPFFARITEPFLEFFRYLPAPAFGALAVAVLGIYDWPKIAIIFIGTFFQQVLVIANTARKLDPSLFEAAETLGANRRQLVLKVAVPGVVVDIYTDLRVLLGWAWTYLIVAELVGTTSGITYFIHQQARYRNYENVYAAIILIGLIGLSSDMILARIGSALFPWTHDRAKPSLARAVRTFFLAVRGAGRATKEQEA